MRSSLPLNGRRDPRGKFFEVTFIRETDYLTARYQIGQQATFDLPLVRPLLVQGLIRLRHAEDAVVILRGGS